MFKNYLIAATIACFSSGAAASQLPDYPFIHAKGSAYLLVMPDMGEIDFDIHAEEATPDAATAVVQARIAEVQQLLAEQGLSADDLDVHSVHKAMEKSGKGDAQAEVYDVKCAVHIVVRDLSKWRNILSSLLDKPNVDSLEVTFGTTARAKLMQDLMASAVKDAQLNAEAMASGFGKRVGAVTAVTSGELKNLSTSIGLVPGDFYFRELEKHGEGTPKSDSPSALLAIAGLKMYQSVDVIFRIR